MSSNIVELTNIVVKSGSWQILLLKMILLKAVVKQILISPGLLIYGNRGGLGGVEFWTNMSPKFCNLNFDRSIIL